ncbi:HEAT repeat domain-containing protein [bacterium]|nr:HEAT repeat domain-containing protein [bacterium]
MHRKRFFINTIMIAGLVLIAQVKLFSEATIIRPDESSGSLDSRWAWSLERIGEYDGCWIGYGSEQLMDDNSWIGSSSDRWGNRPTLRMQIDGIEDSDEVRDWDSVEDAARQALGQWEDEDYPSEQVLKEIAVLFYFSNWSDSDSEIQDIQISNTNRYVDLKGKPLIWMGQVEQDESVSFLEKLYNQCHFVQIREDLVTVVGIHTLEPQVSHFLRDVIQNDESDDVRGNGVFWLGQKASADNLNFLVALAERDRSADVREKAVFSISLMPFEAATDALIKLAREARYGEVQEKAIFWLSQRASEKSVSALEEVVYDQSTAEIKEQAVFALSQFSNDQGIPPLIRIAKTHPSGDIRQKAIFWLGQSDDPKALEAIIAIAKGDDIPLP